MKFEQPDTFGNRCIYLGNTLCICSLSLIAFSEKKTLGQSLVNCIWDYSSITGKDPDAGKD